MDIIDLMEENELLELKTKIDEKLISLKKEKLRNQEVKKIKNKTMISQLEYGDLIFGVGFDKEGVYISGYCKVKAVDKGDDGTMRISVRHEGGTTVWGFHYLGK